MRQPWIPYPLRKHPLVLEWLRRIHKDYDTLDSQDKEFFIVKIANWISRDMGWNDTYNTIYTADSSYTINITGFPKYKKPFCFFIEDAQLEWLLHRIGYNKAVIYMYGKDTVKLELSITDEVPKTETLIQREKLTEDELNPTLNLKNPCNILTPPEMRIKP